MRSKFQEYKLTFVEAFTQKRVLIIGLLITIATVVAVVWQTIGRFVESLGYTFLLGIPSYVVVGGVLSISIVLALFAYAHQIRLTTVPKIKASFDPASGVVVTPTRIHDWKGQIAGTGSAIYVRFKVEAITKAAACRCVAHLIGLKKKVGEGDFQRIEILDPIELSWAYKGHLELEIFPKLPRNVDLVKFDTQSPKLEFAMAVPLLVEGALDEAAKYQFECEVISDGITDSIVIEVDWSNGAAGLSVIQVL
jgi:hypothetical protein